MLDGVDLAATFVLAVECALIGVQADLDLFGILVLSFVGSVGGAVIRDLLLGEHPLPRSATGRYAALAVAATLAVVGASLALGHVGDFTSPLAIDIFEAVGLALAAIAGARKSLDYKLNSAAVVVIATVNGCGGGMLRDVLTARVPSVLHEDFYATAAVAGAVLLVLLVRRFGIRQHVSEPIAGVTIFALRTAALIGEWRLPHLR
ncbi:TRIC cation channel family protein [Sphingomonas sp.]|uniref:trimeric intracellular cation channel family protein n=1 Tax=Sphingomonas sp. TaxID=28214 RepID=UPI0031D16ECC